MTKYYAAVATYGRFSLIGARSDDKTKIQEYCKSHTCSVGGGVRKYHVKEQSETDDLLSSICGVEWL